MLPRPLRVLYLHGFASSPASRKAQFFAARFLEHGIEMETPDLAEENFENLTISAQLRLIHRIVDGRTVSLIGSSLGGYLAALYAVMHPEVERLVLLAPAFGFVDLWKRHLGLEEISRWQKTNQLSVYHYGDKQERNLHYGLLADAQQYPSVPHFSQPALLFHGNDDETVPVSASVNFANNHANARLIRLASDHELGNVLERIWQDSSEFILHSTLAK